MERMGGLVVPTGDTVALAAAIERILNDPKLAFDLAKCGRSRVDSMCSLETVGNQLRHFLIGNQHFPPSTVQ